MSATAAALVDLFSKARLSLRIHSTPSTSRSVVFFDEVLNVEAVLTFAADSLPRIASSSAQTSHLSFPLPLPYLPTSSQLDHENIPPLLYALLACLHVNLYTDYVPEQSPSSLPAPKSTNPYEPLSTVQLSYQHLQLLPSHNPHSDPTQAQLAAVRAFSNSWAGNQPPKAHRTLKDTTQPPTHAKPSSHHAALTRDSHHWSVRWHCRIPVNFIATPFQPLLSITAALTLRLDNSFLDHYLPSSASDQVIRSGFAHSLLTPLHEGPVYPDESPLQSQARAAATSKLGLDGPNGLGSYLAHLPKEVVGGNHTIVTPKSGANALSAIQQRRIDAFSAEPASYKAKQDSNGDLAALSTGSVSNSPASPQPPHLSQSETDASAGLQIYKRSTREILPLKTGINVRMRTLITQHEPSLHRRQSAHHHASPDLEFSRLVLSVELENPLESQSSFLVNSINIDIDEPQRNAQHPLKVVARPLQPLTATLPIELAKGSQHNLLFYVGVDSGQAPHKHVYGIGPAEMAGRVRNVTITVSGRPSGAQQEEMLADFDSQWNCALDLAPVLADAKKKAFISTNPASSLANGGPKAVAEIVAGNTQYSASALSAAQSAKRLSYLGGQRLGGADLGDEINTPRPGQLGVGFPPLLRTASARQFSTVHEIDQIDHPVDSQLAGGFWAKAKARAANRQSQVPSLPNNPNYISVEPWMSSSSSPSNFQTGGLVVLAAVRRAGGGTTLGEVKLESTLGDDGVTRASVSTGSKFLSPTSVGAVFVEERGMCAQTGDTIVLDLTLLDKTSPGMQHETIGDIVLSWQQGSTTNGLSESGRRANRDSVETNAGLLKGRLIDADGARFKSSLHAAQAESINGLIPVEDRLVLQGGLLPGQSMKIALGLRCLSPGYHAIPPLRFSLDRGEQGVEQVLLESLGAVFVTQAAVL